MKASSGIAKLGAALMVCTLAATVHAGAVLDGAYTLGDHPDGAIRPPLYGLRLDGLEDGDTNREYTFSFEASGAAMSMIVDTANSMVTISGTAYGGEDTGAAWTSPELWTIDFKYTDASVDGDGVKATTGTGTIKSATDTYNLAAFGGPPAFFLDMTPAHRGFAGISGWGWLNHALDPASPGSTHIYSSDWLFTAEPVPTPTASVAVLAMLGLWGGFTRLRSRA